MIESYPFFVTKDDKSFRFEFQINKTHEIVTLPCRVNDDLNWTSSLLQLQDLQQRGMRALIKLDLGLEEAFGYDNEIVFKSYILAIDEFNKQIAYKYKAMIDGVILYQGSLNLVALCQLDDSCVHTHIDPAMSLNFNQPFLANLAACNILGSVIHRLVSFIDDDLSCFVIFDDAASFDPLERAIFLSKERFAHIFIIAECPEYQYTTLDYQRGHSLIGYFADHIVQEPGAFECGVLLPSDENLSPESLSRLREILAKIDEPYRLITEKIFNECWNDIQKVYYDTRATHPMTVRMIRGFEASGAESYSY